MILLVWEVILEGGGEPVLENLAIAFGRLTEATRRNAGSAMEGAHEVGKVAEADVEAQRR